MYDTFIKFKYEIRSKINNFKVGYYYCAVSMKAVIGCWYVLGLMYLMVINFTLWFKYLMHSHY